MKFDRTTTAGLRDVTTGNELGYISGKFISGKIAGLRNKTRWRNRQCMSTVRSVVTIKSNIAALGEGINHLHDP